MQAVPRGWKRQGNRFLPRTLQRNEALPSPLFYTSETLFVYPTSKTVHFFVILSHQDCGRNWTHSPSWLTSIPLHFLYLGISSRGWYNFEAHLSPLSPLSPVSPPSPAIPFSVFFFFKWDCWNGLWGSSWRKSPFAENHWCFPGGKGNLILTMNFHFSLCY